MTQNSEQIKQLKKTLLASPEGRLLLTGVTIAFIYTLWLAVMLLVSPQDSQIFVALTATQVMFGRAAAMAFGYSVGLSHFIVVPICMIIETILVLIFFPLFIFSWRHLLVVNWLKNIFERIQKTAEARKPLVRKYGIIGLFAFVWFPFWMTGPFVGAVIGFMLGLRLWLNITVVLSGTYVAIIGWAIFLRQIHKSVASYSSYAAMVLMAMLVIIFITANLLHKTLKENQKVWYISNKH